MRSRGGQCMLYVYVYASYAALHAGCWRGAVSAAKQRPREAKERLSSFTRASHKSPWFLCKSTAKPEPGTSWRTMTDDQGLLR